MIGFDAGCLALDQAHLSNVKANSRPFPCAGGGTLRNENALKRNRDLVNIIPVLQLYRAHYIPRLREFRIRPLWQL